MDKKYKVIIKNSISADGLGIPSISIFYAGCDKKDKTGYFCKGCQNVEMQNKDIDIPSYYNEEIYKYIIQFLSDWTEISDKVAVSFIGGEPLADYNIDSVLYLSRRLKETYNFIDTVLYTWRTKEVIESEGVLNYVEYIDKAVLGEYKESEKVNDYMLGSKNQYIYDFKNREVILSYEER